MGHAPPADDDGLVLGEELGSGAIATVVRVEDPIRGMTYAGKIIHARHERDASAHRRFQREAELASRLAHDNLVRVWGTRGIAGRTVMLMELVHGPNLADHLAREGPMPEPQLVAVARGLASGLAFAHSAGVIHRDLKPANVLLAPAGSAAPMPKIADFGMARASSFAGADKGALTVLGTPQYMAPECLEPLAVDPRTDLYALGCMLFEMATGEPPFRGATPMAVLEAHRTAPIPELPDAFSAGFGRVVRRLLGKAPGDRFQSASAVGDALARCETGGALVLADAQGMSASESGEQASDDGHCARCGESVLRELRVCFSCGLPQAFVAAGDLSVFVTGPGHEPNKLASNLRDRLVGWLRGNAVAGLDGTRLEGQIPRLPFTLLTGVTHDSASSIVASLECLGLGAAIHRGGRTSHGGIHRKTRVLTKRTAAVVAAVFGMPVMIHPAAAIISLPLIGLTLPLVYGVTLMNASKPFVVLTTPPASTLPPRIAKIVSELHRVVGSIAERRHRDALRAVVNRVVTLCRGITDDDIDRPEVEAEMEHAISLAAHATTRMDALDRLMADPSFDPADPQHRDRMHERDMWSARLLDLTATLDTLVVRRAAAEAKMRPSGHEELHDLRAMVEALEEVQQQ